MPNRIKIKRPRKGTKSEAIIALSTLTNANPSEITKIVQTTKSNVSQALSRYGLSPNITKLFKENRAEILAGYQDKIIKSMNGDAINNASLMQKAASFGILYDKERLERDLSTANVAAIHDDIAALRRMEDVDNSELEAVDNSVIDVSP